MAHSDSQAEQEAPGCAFVWMVASDPYEGPCGRAAAALLAIACLAGPAAAQLRPMPRPDVLPLAVAERPMPRPDGLGSEPGEAAPAAAEDRAEPPGAAAEPEAPVIGPALAERVAATLRAEAAAEAAAHRAVGRLWLAERGPPCGEAGVEGERVEPVTGAGECGIDRPVRVERIAGVTLDPAPVLDCRLVKALGEWLAERATPLFAADGAALEGLGIAGGYVCRGINYDDEGDISEHGRGLAIDIARFERADGSTIAVLDGWGSADSGMLLARLHGDACGIFGTALGPESNAWHQDHFHYDAAGRRRAYCPEGYVAEEDEEQEEGDQSAF